MTSVYRPHPNAAWRSLGDRVVAITPDNRQHELEGEVEVLVWRELAAGARDLDQLTAAVVRAFDIGEAEARADLRDFLEELVGAGLVNRT